MLIIYAGLAIVGIWQSWLPWVAERRFRDGFNVHASGNYPVAEKLLLEAVHNAPWETYYGSFLGRSYEDWADSERDPSTKKDILLKSEAVYLDIIGLDRTNPWYLNRLASIYQKMAGLEPQNQGNFLVAADRHIRLAAKVDRNNPLFVLNLAYFLHQHNQEMEAIPLYKKVIQWDGRIVEARYNLGDIYRRRKMNEEALEQYTAILKIDPAFSNAPLAVAELYGAKGEETKAIPYLEAALKVKPFDFNLMRYLVGIYHRSGMLDKAIPMYWSIVEAYPQTFDTLHPSFVAALRAAGRTADLDREAAMYSAYLKQKHAQPPTPAPTPPTL